MALIPLPTNLLPHWFFPWNTPTWNGYTPYIVHKELLAVDAIRQIFIWKEYAFSLIKTGVWPLWNPYNFSGQPLLANFQTGVFYPLSWIFLLFDPITSWSLFIYIQPVLAAFFMFVYLRNRLKSNLPAIFGSVGIIFCNFFITRYFWGVYIHSLLWIPLGLYLVDKLAAREISKSVGIALLSVVFSLSILGGYPQFAVFSLILVSLYFLAFYGIRNLWMLILSLALSMAICGAQLMPTFELYQNSLRDSSTSLNYFSHSILQPKYLISVVSPDFWGSPGVNSYFGGVDYSGMNGYFGIVPLIFATVAVLTSFREKSVRFWVFISALGLILSYQTGISLLPAILHIPIISSGGAWGNLFFFHFGSIVLSAFGLKAYLVSRTKKNLFVSIGIWIGVLLIILFVGHSSSVSLRNTFLILITVFTGGVAALLSRKLSVIGFILLTIVSGVYFAIKLLPFGNTNYFYPQHPLVSFLQDQGSVNRFDGYGKAKFNSNFATHFKIFGVDGYDSLWPKWYGQLLSTTDTGEIPNYVDRADVNISDHDTVYRQKLINLLGVKFILDRSDDPLGDRGHNVVKFPVKDYKLVGQWGIVSVYENLQAYPRTFLTNNIFRSTPSDVLANMYSNKVSLKESVIISDQSLPLTNNLVTGQAQMISYQPNQIIIESQSAGPSALVLTDTYYPGWQASVNGLEAKIYRADYAFRMILVPEGINRIIFTYEPKSFKDGLRLSLAGVLIFLCLIVLPRFSRLVGRR